MEEFLERVKYLLRLSKAGKSKNKDWRGLKKLLQAAGYWKNRYSKRKNAIRNLGVGRKYY